MSNFFCLFKANTSPVAEPESPTVEMDSLEAISTVSLPLDLPSALLGSPSRAQHLLVVTTPASCSIVTQGGAILSPAQTVQALTECGNSSGFVWILCKNEFIQTQTRPCWSVRQNHRPSRAASHSWRTQSCAFPSRIHVSPKRKRNNKWCKW